MDSSRQVSLAKKCALSRFYLAGVLCLVILGWIVDPSLADKVGNADFSQIEIRILRLGQERTREKLPFRGGDGKCLYELMDMKEAHWYEVKISYPASTPAVFSVDLLPVDSGDSISSARKLLKTEKSMFCLPEQSAFKDIQVGMKRRVLVSVKPEGFVAQPYVGEQEFIIYNIRLEEVVLGIPLQAFWVGFLGLIALCASVLAARQITSRLQPLLLQQLKSKTTTRAL